MLGLELVVFVFVGWMLSLCLHEFGHAIAAYWGGDVSVKDKGYLTLNPLKYVDPVLTLILPMVFLLIGGIGLPGALVYINPSQIRNRLWLSLTSIAGPFANFVTTIVLVAIYKFGISQISQSRLLELSEYSDSSDLAKYWFILGLALLIFLQIFTVIFNLLPIPSLDGYGVIEPWLPPQWQRHIQPVKRYALLIVMALFWVLPSFGRKISQWSYHTTEFLGIDPDYVSTGFTLFQKSATPLIVGVFVVFMIWRKLTLKKHQVLYETALADQRTGKLDGALRDLDQAIALEPNFTPALLLKADIHYSRQEFTEAIKIWEVIKTPEDQKFQSSFSLALWQLGRMEEALALCDRQLVATPNDSYVWQIKAGILNNLQREQEALEACDRGLKISPETTYLWEIKGAIFQNQQDLEQALAAYNQVTVINPKSISAWIAQSKILIALNRYQDAFACSDRALQIDPRELETIQHHSYMLCLLGQHHEAIRYLDLILQMDAKNANAYYNKACCYAQQEQLSLAIAQLKSAFLYDQNDLQNDLKEQAKTDDSFTKIRHTQEFQQLVN